MGENNVVTQSTVNQVNAALGELADQLDAHVRASMAKSHGFDVLQFAAPTLDAAGNDIQYYRDSGGSIVGQFQLRATVGNVVYYAPAATTALAGQPDSSSSLIGSAALAAALGSTASDAWSTEDYTEALTTIETIRDDLLLPHTRLGHWEAHAPLSVYAKATTDSGGDTVGRHVLIFQFDGVKYEIPCDTRLGGPPQRPRLSALMPTVHFNGNVSGNFSLQGTTLYMHVSSGDPWPSSVDITYQLSGGTHPITYLWEYSLNGTTWTSFVKDTPVAGTESNDARLTLTSVNNGTVPTSGTHTINFGITSPGGDNGSRWYIRCTFTSAGGSYVTVPLYVDMKDSASKFLCTLAFENGVISREVLARDVLFSSTLDAATRAGYRLWARPLAHWLRGHAGCRKIVLRGVAHWARYTASRTGLDVEYRFLGHLFYLVGRPVCRVLGWLTAPIARRKATPRSAPAPRWSP